MYMSRCCPLMAIVPISLFLTLSFFVLSVLRKIEEKWLKIFGYVVVSFLLLSALVVFSGAVFHMTNGLGGMKCKMMQKMKMGSMSRMMQQNSMPCMAMPEKGELSKE